MSTSLDSVIGKVYSVSKSIFWPSANEIWQPWTTPQAYPLSCHYVWHQTLSFLGWRSLNIEAATTITWVSRIKCWQEIVFVLRTLESCFSYLRNFCDPLQDSWSACNCPISACSRNHPMACTVSYQQPAPLFQKAGRSRQSVRKKSLPDPRNSWKIPVTPVAVLQLCSCCFNPFWLFPLFGLFLLCRLLLQSNAANSWNFNEAEPHMLYVSCGPKLKKKKSNIQLDWYLWQQVVACTARLQLCSGAGSGWRSLLAYLLHQLTDFISAFHQSSLFCWPTTWQRWCSLSRPW